MLIKNRDKIAEIGHLIPPVLNMYGVSADQNEVVLRKIYGLQLTQMKVANAISVTFQQIQKYEKGMNAVSLYNELKLSEYFGCDRNYFIQPLLDNGYKFLNKQREGNNHDNQE